MLSLLRVDGEVPVGTQNILPSNIKADDRNVHYWATFDISPKSPQFVDEMDVESGTSPVMFIVTSPTTMQSFAKI